MTGKNTTGSYMELSAQAYNLFTEAIGSANQRTLDFMKSVYEISTRPYASTALETTMRENFDRANQVLALSIAEMQTTGQKAVEFNEKLVSHGAKLQDTVVASMRGLTETGISNMNFVKEATSQQIDELSKRLDEVQNRAVAQVSAN